MPTETKDAQESMVGQVVAGRFRVLEQLGEGTVGDIYLAQHDTLKRPFALKVLKRRFLLNRTVAERFRREAHVASRLEHPNIVEISDFGMAENGRLFLAMELIEGESLGQAIEQHLPRVMPLQRALAILSQVADAVGAAHDAGVLHRDLKPENIMLGRSATGSEVVKILDFGLAKLMVDEYSLVLTRRGEMFGTPMYMSPEQARGEDLDSRTDIYAFGAIAFEVCTGRPPFVSERLDELLTATQTKQPPAPSSVQPPGTPRIPPRLDRAILHCLEKDRDDRPLRLSEVRAVIDHCLARHTKPPSPYVQTLEYEKVDPAELEAEISSSAEEQAAARPELESLVDASIVEIDPWHWRQVCKALVDVAQILKEQDQCPLEAVSLVGTLGRKSAEEQTMEAGVEARAKELEALETQHRERAAQLRHAVIDLSLERGQVAEDADADPQRLVDLDFQIMELEQRLAAVYREGIEERAEPERLVREAEERVEQIRQQRHELEFRLLHVLRVARPVPAPPEVDIAYDKLEELIRSAS